MGIERFTDPAKIGQVVAFLALPRAGTGLLAPTPIPLIWLGPQADGSPLWQVDEDVSYYDATLSCTFSIPKGYTFDLASIPRSLRWLIAPFELSTLAPLLHDFIYGNKGYMREGECSPPKTVFPLTEKDADDLFLRVMKVEGVSRWRRNAAWLAVRAFGFTFWNRHPDPPVSVPA